MGSKPDKTEEMARQLADALDTYEEVVAESDPRDTASMSDDDYQLVLEILTEPLALEDSHIARLGDYLASLPAFTARARERKIDPTKLRDLLNGYTFPEQLHLVDAAMIRHSAPRPK
jgi:hypothetical protein